MARNRPSVSADLRRFLIEEAGHKCANPGCANFRAHLHHIEQWAIYEAHDAETMIALCPTCHDAVHFGSLAIDDATLLRWKEIQRPPQGRDHIYVEPAAESSLLLGSLAITGQQGVIIFELSPANRLSFRVIDEDVMLLDLAVADTAGREVLRVVGGHLRRAVAPVTYERVPGHVRVTAPKTERFVPDWVLEKLRFVEPEFVADEAVVLLDVEVIEPGYVRVQGLWTKEDTAVVITERVLSFLRIEVPGPISLVGAGKESVLHYAGPITSALFGFGAGARITVPRPLAPAPGRNDPCWCGSGTKYKKCHGQ